MTSAVISKRAWLTMIALLALSCAVHERNLQYDSCGTDLPCSSSTTCLGGQCCEPPAAGGDCNLPACGCGAGQVCYPADSTSGLQCFDSTGLTEGADCTDPTAMCNEGLGCFAGICKPYCTTDSDCRAVAGVQNACKRPGRMGRTSRVSKSAREFAIQ